MLIKFYPVKVESSIRMPVTESWFAARRFYGFSGLGIACPAETVPMGDKCCIPQSNWDGMDKRCVLAANNPGVITTQNGKHLKAGAGGGGGTPPPACTPNCAGIGTNGGGVLKTCGDDGCGGSCGTCSGTDECLAGQCVPSTSGGGGTTTGGGAWGGGGGTSVSVGGDGGGLDISSLLQSPVVWVAGGLLLVAVTYRIFKGAGKSPAASGVTVVR